MVGTNVDHNAPNVLVHQRRKAPDGPQKHGAKETVQGCVPSKTCHAQEHPSSHPTANGRPNEVATTAWALDRVEANCPSFRTVPRMRIAFFDRLYHWADHKEVELGVRQCFQYFHGFRIDNGQIRAVAVHPNELDNWEDPAVDRVGVVVVVVADRLVVVVVVVVVVAGAVVVVSAERCQAQLCCCSMMSSDHPRRRIQFLHATRSHPM